MNVLPPRTLPPTEPLTRRHRPKPIQDWAEYRRCLRWDFGFTCAFCLLHEADFFSGLPGEGLGIMTVEHRILKRDDPSLAGVYTNCLYACRLCNVARGTKDLRTPEARLLDPTEDPWARHFEVSGSSLCPKSGDADARYTFEAYDLDDKRKTSRRQARRELIEDRLKLLSRIEEELAALLDLADELRGIDVETFLEMWREISDLRQQARRARGDLSFYEAVPQDAPVACRCSPPRDLTFPPGFARQCPRVESASPG